ncbi:homogentisate 1,2-dioxygenase [Novosphingobium profundi]|nr:homogentisate 1,2-dioxygenase [Novosphingobium profundi]
MAVALVGGGAHAQEAMGEANRSEVACTDRAPLPPEFASWVTPETLTAAGDRQSLPKATIGLGRAVDAQLLPTRSVSYQIRPEKPGGSVSYGGLFTFRIERTGTYRIGLGSAAWIDVVREGKALVSTAHGHGPECSGIRKLVAFALTPGTYTLQVSANADPQVEILIASAS